MVFDPFYSSHGGLGKGFLHISSLVCCNSRYSIKFTNISLFSNVYFDHLGLSRQVMTKKKKIVRRCLGPLQTSHAWIDELVPVFIITVYKHSRSVLKTHFFTLSKRLLA